MSSRVWLITGANSGLGLALAEHVLSKGDKLIAAVRRVSAIPDSLKAAKPLTLDLNASDADIRKAAQEALTIYGRIDVLVNNAGYCLTGPIEELDDSDLKKEFQANFFGAMSLTQAILPSLRAQKSGHILNLSSIAAFAGGPGFGGYNASKAALEAATEALNVEVTKFNIRVTIVEPGHFPTNFLSVAGSNMVRPDRVTGAYMDPSQGHGGIERMGPIHIEAGQVGDVHKAAARIFEFVSGTGLAESVVREGKREWVRLPLGPDCGRRMMAKIQTLTDNVNALEPVWSSTDMDAEQLKAVKDGHK